MTGQSRKALFEEWAHTNGKNDAWDAVGDKDIAEEGFQAGYQAHATAQQAALREAQEAWKALGPFEIVQGDAVHRTSPTSRQVVNSNIAWLVSGGERSAHKLQKWLAALDRMLEG